MVIQVPFSFLFLTPLYLSISQQTHSRSSDANVTQRWNGILGRNHSVAPRPCYVAEDAAGHTGGVAYSGHTAVVGHWDQAPVSHLLVHWDTCFSGYSVGEKEKLQGTTCLEMLQATFSLESFSAHYLKATKALHWRKLSNPAFLKHSGPGVHGAS